MPDFTAIVLDWLKAAHPSYAAEARDNDAHYRKCGMPHGPEAAGKAVQMDIGGAVDDRDRTVRDGAQAVLWAALETVDWAAVGRAILAGPAAEAPAAWTHPGPEYCSYGCCPADYCWCDGNRPDLQ